MCRRELFCFDSLVPEPPPVHTYMLYPSVTDSSEVRAPELEYRRSAHAREAGALRQRLTLHMHLRKRSAASSIVHTLISTALLNRRLVPMATTDRIMDHAWNAHLAIHARSHNTDNAPMAPVPAFPQNQNPAPPARTRLCVSQEVLYSSRLQ